MISAGVICAQLNDGDVSSFDATRGLRRLHLRRSWRGTGTRIVRRIWRIRELLFRSDREKSHARMPTKRRGPIRRTAARAHAPFWKFEIYRWLASADGHSALESALARFRDCFLEYYVRYRWILVLSRARARPQLTFVHCLVRFAVGQDGTQGSPPIMHAALPPSVRGHHERWVCTPTFWSSKGKWRTPFSSFDELIKCA